MKILVISNNCFSNSQSMGKTLNSIFCNFVLDEVCQLYFYSSIPDMTNCKEFFRISDYDLVKGRLFGNIGSVVLPRIQQTQTLFENEGIKNVYSKFNRSNPFVAFARTFMWDLARWNSKKLNAWIAKMSPDIIFFASGDTIFSYKVVDYISKKYNIPVITYVCDEFYYGFEEKNLLGKMYHYILNKWMHRILEKSVMVAAICEPLGELYKRTFNKPYYVLHTGASVPICQEIDVKVGKKEISYLGNLSLNRWKSLIEIGEALDRVNLRLREDFTLNIYSGESDNNILQRIQGPKSVRFHGKITPDDCSKVIKESLAVVHTESFDDANIKRVQYSMSTKVADSLASGTCFFVYGSEELASVKYLKDNDVAIVATSKHELEVKLTELVQDENVRYRLISKAIKLAKKNHIATVNSSEFKNRCKEALRIGI